MKVSQNIGFYFNNNRDFRERILNTHVENMKDSKTYNSLGEEKQAYAKENLKELFEPTDNKTLIIQDDARKVIDNIRVNMDLPLNIKNQKTTCFFKDGIAIRFWVKDNNCYGILLMDNPQKQDHVSWLITRIDFNLALRYDNEDGDTLVHEFSKRLYSLIVFLQFSDPEIEVLKPNQKNHATRASGNKILNNSKESVTIVNSKWNTISIPDGESTVSGHFRLQPCGEGRTDRKLIFINEHSRKRNKIIRNTFRKEEFKLKDQ